MGAEIEKLIRSQQPAAMSATLYTIGLDGQRTKCLRWDGPFDDHCELLEQVEERALRQANALGGVHSFCFELCDGAGTSLGCEFFRLSAEAFSGERSMLAEPANEGGVLAQSMRLTEAFARLQVQGSERSGNLMLKQLEAIARRAEHSESRYLEALQVLQRVLTGERQAEVEAIRADGNARAKVAIANRVATLLGPIASGMIAKYGGDAGPQAAIATAVQGFVSSLNQEQLEKIISVLQPEQAAAVFQLVSAVKTDEAQAGATEAPPPRRKANGDARH